MKWFKSIYTKILTFFLAPYTKVMFEYLQTEITKYVESVFKIKTKPICIMVISCDSELYEYLSPGLENIFNKLSHEYNIIPLYENNHNRDRVGIEVKLYSVTDEITLQEVEKLANKVKAEILWHAVIKSEAGDNVTSKHENGWFKINGLNVGIGAHIVLNNKPDTPDPENLSSPLSVLDVFSGVAEPLNVERYEV